VITWWLRDGRLAVEEDHAP